VRIRNSAIKPAKVVDDGWGIFRTSTKFFEPEDVGAFLSCLMSEVPCLMSEVPCLMSEVSGLMSEVPYHILRVLHIGLSDGYSQRSLDLIYEGK
jgi:hypothetical protein